MIGSILKFVLDKGGARRFVPRGGPGQRPSEPGAIRPACFRAWLSSDGLDPLLSLVFLCPLKQILVVRVRLSPNRPLSATKETTMNNVADDMSDDKWISCSHCGLFPLE
jgi:hypothetical protein